MAPVAEGRARRAQARIDLGAIEENCALLGGRLTGGASLCAVVKADAYGHGVLPVARAALAGGARMLAVVSAAEAEQLRAGGLDDARLLVMGPLTAQELERALAVRAEVAIWSPESLALVVAVGGGAIHIKFDSGMGRFGLCERAAALNLAEAALAEPRVELAGVMSHLATADVLEDGGFFERQLAAFAELTAALRELQPAICAHVANSAALLRDGAAHFDMARCGVALYGMDPFGEDPLVHGLRPALSLHSHVAQVKLLKPGQSTGYGRRFIAERPTWIGLVPVGYADGFRRVLSGRAEVLVAGARRRQIGTVSMDSIAVELGQERDCEQLLGADVCLIGRQGAERIGAEQLARWAGTINYEITCGIGSRVERVHLAGSTGR